MAGLREALEQEQALGRWLKLPDREHYSVCSCVTRAMPCESCLQGREELSRQERRYILLIGVPDAAISLKASPVRRPRAQPRRRHEWDSHRWYCEPCRSFPEAYPLRSARRS